MIQEIAQRIADKLLEELRRGVLIKIDIDIIRQTLRDDVDCPPVASISYYDLEKLTVRKVVEGIG